MSSTTLLLTSSLGVSLTCGLSVSGMIPRVAMAEVVKSLRSATAVVAGFAADTRAGERRGRTVDEVRRVRAAARESLAMLLRPIVGFLMGERETWKLNF